MDTDGLKNNEERALAWKAIWNASFAGIAIVNEDFTFRTVNRQFCKIVGVTQAELVGKKFTDITPEPLRTLDALNAKLVIEGKGQKNYVLPKSYEFPNGNKVDITLIARGVYGKDGSLEVLPKEDKRKPQFLFFVSSIMEDKSCDMLPPPSPSPTLSTEWLDKKKIGMAVLLALMAIGAGIAKVLLGL